jgi:hypothetical protein
MLQPTYGNRHLMVFNGGDHCQWTYLRNLAKIGYCGHLLEPTTFRHLAKILGFFWIFCGFFAFKNIIEFLRNVFKKIRTQKERK